MAGQKTDLNFQKSSWLSKALSFFRIGAWWSGKGAKIEPQDKAVPVETKNEEPEAEPVLVQASAAAKAPWYKGLFKTILSFVRWGYEVKGNGQGDGASGKDLSVDQPPKAFTEGDLNTAIGDYDYNKVQEIIKANPDWVHKKAHPSIEGFRFLNYAIFHYLDKLDSDKKDSSIKIVRFLANKMKQDSNLKDYDNSGDLLWAVQFGQIVMVKLFVEEYSATVSSDCLLAAAEPKALQDNHSGEILTFLLEQEIEQEVLDDALRQVARQNTKGGGYEMYNAAVQDLVTRGADVNSQDKDGDTALHIAIYYSKFSTIEVLLNNNACRDIKNAKGITPIALMNEKLLRSQEDLSNANDCHDVLCDRNENTTRANNNQREYESRCNKWYKLIELCANSSCVEEESDDDVLVHNPDGVGDRQDAIFGEFGQQLEPYPLVHQLGAETGQLPDNGTLLLKG